MSDIIDEVFTSIHLIVDKKISDLKLDKTIQAVVVSNVDTLNNLYRISYQGVEYDAYGPLDRSFDINSSVLVLVPENNFSNKKIIVSLVDKQPDTLIVGAGSIITIFASPYTVSSSSSDITNTSYSGAPHNHSGSSDNAGEHNHGGATSTGGSHTHGVSTMNSAGSHNHSASTGSAGGHNHGITGGTTLAISPSGSVGFVVASDHSHSISTDGSHTHTGSTDSSGSHDHSISTQSAHNHGITVSSNTIAGNLNNFVFFWENDLKPNGRSVYLEAVFSLATSGTGLIGLKKYGASEVSLTPLSSTSTSLSRVRSSAITLENNTEYVLTISNAILSTARLVII